MLSSVRKFSTSVLFVFTSLTVDAEAQSAPVTTQPAPSPTAKTAAPPTVAQTPTNAPQPAPFRTMDLVQKPIGAITSGAETVVEKVFQKGGRWDFLFESGRQNYQLTSATGGLNVSMGSMAHYRYGATYVKPIEDRQHLYGLHMANQSRTSPFLPNSTTTTYSPNVFNTRAMDLFWEKNDFVHANEASNWKKFYLGFGALLQSRWADQSTPSQLIASSLRAGFLFSMGYEKHLGGNWGYEVKGRLFLPTLFQEYGFQTASYNWSMSPTTSFKFVYRVSELIDFSIGFVHDVEQNFYNGSGNRGGLNPTETITQFAVPLELRFKM